MYYDYKEIRSTDSKNFPRNPMPKFYSHLMKTGKEGIVLRSFILTVCMLSLFLFGCTKTVDIEGEKLNYEQLLDKVEALNEQVVDLEEKKKDYETELSDTEKELDEVNQELDTVNQELDERAVEFASLLDLADEEEALKKKVKSLKKELETKEKEKEDLNSDIKGKEKELSKMEDVITKKKEDPIELIAGEYIIGEDIPADRYQATNIGDGSNFVVRSASGSLKVNTILGDSIVGSGDYVFFGDEGDIIETRAPVKLIPVE